MADKGKQTPKKVVRICTVVTCRKPIGEFGHVCDYPGKSKN